MSTSLNRAQIIGNLTRDPEFRQTPSGQSVVSLGVATNRRFKTATGEFQEETEFHDVVFWGSRAEFINQYLKKGRKVYVEGRLKTRSWEDPDGKKNYRTEIIGENILILDSSRAAQPDSASEAQVDTQLPAEEEIDIQDLPF